MRLGRQVRGRSLVAACSSCGSSMALEPPCGAQMLAIPDTHAHLQAANLHQKVNATKFHQTDLQASSQGELVSAVC